LAPTLAAAAAAAAQLHQQLLSLHLKTQSRCLHLLTQHTRACCGPGSLLGPGAAGKLPWKTEQGQCAALAVAGPEAGGDWPWMTEQGHCVGSAQAVQ